MQDEQLGHTSGRERAGGNGPRSGERSPEIDVERLADLVYRLMMAEARLTRARGGETAFGRKG